MASPEPQLQNPLFLPLHFSILFLSLILPPFRHRPSVFIPLLILTFIPLTLHPLVSDPAASYGVATLWTFTFRAITLLLFTVPEHTLHRPSKELPGAPAAFTLRRKIGWVLSLLVSPRGVGWNVHAPFPAAVRAKSRRAYIRHAMLRALGLYLILDLSRTWNVHQPYMLAQDQRGFMLVTDPERRVWERTLDVAANAGSAWGYIEMQYLLVSAVVVGVFGGVPEEWPPLFGSLADAWCVKRLWGRVWHQMLRGSLRPWWRVVVEGLGLDPGGVAAELVGVFVAFGISGVGHAVAMWTLDRSLGWGQIAFFMLQAVGILVETVVCRAYVSATTYSRKPPHEKGMILGKTDKSLGGTEKLVARLVGYVWVVGWLVYTAPLQTDEFILAGLYRANPAPVSPTHWVLERFGYAGGGV